MIHLFVKSDNIYIKFTGQNKLPHKLHTRNEIGQVQWKNIDECQSPIFKSPWKKKSPHPIQKINSKPEGGEGGRYTVIRQWYRNLVDVCL